MKTIKIIDLLIKISKGEEVPNMIKYRNNICEYNDVDYFGNDIGYLFESFNITAILNDEVEILEEEKKIPKKIPEDVFEDYTKTAKVYQLYKLTNEIIDYLESKEKGE